jgi:hypothetical protein
MTAKWVMLIRLAGVVIGVLIIKGWAECFLLPTIFHTPPGMMLHVPFGWVYWVVASVPLIVPWRRVRIDIVWLLLFVLLCLDGIALVGWGTMIVWRFREVEKGGLLLKFGIWWFTVTVAVLLQIPAVLSIRRHVKAAVAPA